MNIFEFKMPKMGESISEATLINWTKKVGDYIEAEETLLEVATDKVDSEVPSPVSGTITEIRFQKDDVVEVGKVLALIKSEAGSQKLEVENKGVFFRVAPVSKLFFIISFQPYSEHKQKNHQPKSWPRLGPGVRLLEHVKGEQNM